MDIHTLEDWNSYSLNESPPYWMLSEMSRAEARRCFNRTIELKELRIRVLKDLLAGSGINIEDDYSGVQSLNDWFIESIRPLADRNLPDGRSLSLCEDVALLLGDLMVSRHPCLRWEFFVWGRKNVAYQSHVIMGFPGGEKNRENVDLPRVIYGYAAHILAERLESTELIDVPDGHPLSGVRMPRVPVDRTKFLRLLEHVDRQCAAA